MTIDDIANYCEFTSCEVSAGDPQTGIIHIDGNGLRDRSYTWGRFHMLHEVSGLPSPRETLRQATSFRTERAGEIRTFSRAEFEQELEKFRQKVG